MTFPLDVRTQLLFDGVWTDVTGDVYQRDPITITRGRSDEAATVEPSRCNLTFDNRAGDYSPRNPVGTHFGVLGRNTPLRVLTPGTEDPYLALSGIADTHALTPDTASLDITGDIDIRLELEPQTWRPPTLWQLARKAEDATGWSWFLFLGTDGKLTFAWSTDGAGTGYQFHASTVAVPASVTRFAIRVTLDVDNGAAGNDVKFYLAPTIGGTWSQLGATVTTAGTTSIFASGSDLKLGILLHAKIYAFEVRNGIAGTLVTSPDFTIQDSGSTGFMDAQGRPWTLNAPIVNPNARYHGEVSSWPPRWNQPGTDVYVPIQADGILRRLGQGASALKSTLYRGLTAAADVVAYWPMEDGTAATELASALPDAPPMTINPTVGTEVRLSTYTGFKASEALPEGSGAIFAADVPDYPLAIPTKVQVRFLIHVPSGGIPNEGVIARVFTSGSAGRWDLRVDSTNDLRLIVFDTDGNQIHDSGLIVWGAGGINGKNLRVSLGMERVGADVTYQIVTIEVGQTNGYVYFGTVTGRSLGKATRVVVNSARFDGPAYGHVSVHNQITSIFDLSSELNAWIGETAAARIMRLCRDENVPIALIGKPLAGTNLLTAAQASFEDGTTGGWIAGGTVLPTLTNDTAHPSDGHRSLKIHWNGAGVFPQGQLTLSGYVAGMTYTVAADVYIPSGSPDVYIGGDSATSALTPIKNRMHRIWTAFVAATTTPVIKIVSSGAAGDVWVDRVMVNVGDTPAEYSTLGPTGTVYDSVTMGPQLPMTLLDLLREAADADMGILYEPRGFLGLAYRTRASLQSQVTRLALDYTAGHLTAIEPTEDDQRTRNDITVERPSGASARAELTTGPLSTLPPPDGVGRYDEKIIANIDLDAGLADQAGWRLHMGTVDEARYPVLGINLATDPFTDDAALSAAAQTLDVGEKVTVARPPAWLPPETIGQLAQGTTETLTRHQWEIAVNCSPASSWDVGVWDAASGPGEARYSSDGSSLSAGATATATSLSVATPSGPLWSSADGPFDLYVAGERMTVTGITGASSPQTFTVVRSVNGVVKAQASGAEVRLFQPAVFAL